MSVYDHLTSDFQKHLFNVLATNEGYGPNNDDIAYSVSFANDGIAGNKSGYSTGWIQWDLPQRGVDSEPYKIISDAVDNITTDT